MSPTSSYGSDAQIEKELLAVSFSCQKLHNYIYGHNNIVIYTYHQPSVSIIKKELDIIQNNRIQRLRIKLILYKFDLMYLPGKFKYIADLLSRNVSTNNIVKDDESMIDIIQRIKIGDIKFSLNEILEYKNNVLEDEALQLVMEYYKTGWPKNIKKLAENSELLIIVN